MSPNDRLKNVTIYREAGRFAGWPANHGIWSWGNEIVVGFKLGHYRKNPAGGHAIDREKPDTRRQARSTDGGKSWTVEVPSFIEGGREPERCPEEPIDFDNPDLAIKFRSRRYFYSPDRCRTWEGPFSLPTFGRDSLLARTDYMVEGKHELTAFLAASKDDGDEGQPLCVRTTDGGKTWNLIGWIGEQPPVETYGYAIMPSTVRLRSGAYLTMIRRAGVFDGKKKWWLEAYLSPDRGSTWYMLDRPRIDNAGNPASMIVLQDGRIALTYGWRRPPYGIRAMISTDDGQTWSPEFVLRHDGASWDLGYPRTVQRTDGRCVTVYYYHDHESPERYIAATIWDPFYFLSTK